MTTRRPVRGRDVVAGVLVGLAAVHTAGAVGLAVGESAAVGVLYFLMFAAPALAVGLALRSAAHGGTTGVAALLLGAFYALVVAGNWATYDMRSRVLIPLLCAPLVAAYVAAFLVTAARPGTHARRT